MNAIVQRQSKSKELILELLKKTPIIQIVCEKAGVARATFYRWRKENQAFAEQADEALLEGKLLINDMAESRLISAIRDGNMTGIIFWLRSHHKDYANKIEINSTIDEPVKLTPEQENLIKNALAILKQDKKEGNGKK